MHRSGAIRANRVLDQVLILSALVFFISPHLQFSILYQAEFCANVRGPLPRTTFAWKQKARGRPLHPGDERPASLRTPVRGMMSTQQLYDAERKLRGRGPEGVGFGRSAKVSIFRVATAGASAEMLRGALRPGDYCRHSYRPSRGRTV